MSLITTFVHLPRFLSTTVSTLTNKAMKFLSIQSNISVHFSEEVVGKNIHLDTSIFLIKFECVFSGMLYCCHLKSPSLHNPGNFLCLCCVSSFGIWTPLFSSSWFIPSFGLGTSFRGFLGMMPRNHFGYLQCPPYY